MHTSGLAGHGPGGWSPLCCRLGLTGCWLLAPATRNPRLMSNICHRMQVLVSDPSSRPHGRQTTDRNAPPSDHLGIVRTRYSVLGTRTRHTALSGGGYLSSRDAHPRPRPSSSHRASCSARHSAGVEQAHGVMPGVRRIRNRADKAAAPPPRRSGSGLLTVIELPPPAPPRVSRSTRVVCPSAPRLHPCVPALATGVPGWRP